MSAAIGLTDILRKNLYWIVGSIIGAACLAFTEGSLIVTTKMFGVTKATLLRISFTIPLSWLVVYLSTKTRRSFHFSNWLAAKEAKLSRRAKLAVSGGKFVAIVNTAVLLGPIISSILMLMIGIRIQRVYAYAVVCAFFSAWIWCAFYSGMLWGLGKIFLS